MDPLTMAMLASAAMSAYGAYSASNKSSGTQEQMYGQGLAQQREFFGQAQNALNPFIQGGASALPTLSKLITPGADMGEVLSQIPGFKFAQQYGQKAITNQATSRGLSGNALTAGADYATGAASQTYGGIVNALQALVDTGGRAGGALAGAAGGAGNAALSAATGAGKSIGDTQSAGILGATNALGTGMNSYTNMSMLDRLMRQNGGTGKGLFSDSSTTAAVPYTGMSPWG